MCLRNRDARKLKWRYKEMPKRMTVIGDRVLWEKVTRGRAGIRGDSVGEKVWKDIGGTKKRYCP